MSEEQSLRDTLANAPGWGGGTGSREDTSASTPEPVEAPATEGVGDAPAAESKVETPAVSDAGATKPADPVAAKDPAPAGTDPAHEVAPPPNFKDAEAWKSTPLATKQFLKQREAEFQRGFQKQRQAADFGTHVFRALSPIMGTLQQQGVHPVAAIEGMARLIGTLRSGTQREKAEAFAGAAQEYGVDLRSLVENGLPSDSTSVSPELAEIRRYRQEQTQRDAWLQQQQQQQAFQQAQQHITAFSADPDVAALLPFVHEDMARILESSLIDETGKTPEQVVREAFEKACSWNPSVKKQREADSLAKQAEEAKRLRSGASVSAGSNPVSGKQVPTDLSVRGLLEAAWPS